jgi:hypothetical protein
MKITTLRKLKYLSLWKIAYIFCSFILAYVACWRLLWSWPQVNYLSNLFWITDIDNLLRHQYHQVGIADFSNGQTWNGYRWFQYVNAALWGLNPQIEIVLYFSITFAMSLIIGLRVLSENLDSVYKKLLVFSIPILLQSLVGAGSRGMELLTFFGLLSALVLYRIIESSVNDSVFFISVVFIPPFLFFISSGGYTLAVVTSCLVAFVVNRRQSTNDSDVQVRLRTTLLILLGNFLLYWLVLVMSPSTGANIFSVFIRNTQQNPFFPLGYILSSLSGGLISIQTFERFTTMQSLVLTLLIGIAVAFFTILTLYFGSRVNTSQSIGLILTSLYGLMTAVTMMPFRPLNMQWLLNTWYSLHFKMGLAGSIGLLIVTISKVNLLKKPFLGAMTVFIPLMVAIVVIANINQFRREIHERQYFISMVRDTLFPSGLMENEAGLTSLQLSLPESIKAVEIQRSHKLGVFNDRDKSLKLVGALGKPFVLAGSVFPDGWVGKNFSIYVLDQECLSIDISLVTDSHLQKNTVEVDLNNDNTQEIEIGTSPAVTRFSLKGENPVLNFSFRETFTPSEVSESQDGRVLAAVVGVTCIP